MIKQTLYFGNPAYLSVSNHQMIWKAPNLKKQDNTPKIFNSEFEKSFNIEDLGFVVFDNSQITVTQALLSELMTKNVAVIICDNSHHPNGLSLSLNGNSIINQRQLKQTNISLPLQKQLWSQIIVSKIENQASSIKLNTGNLNNCNYLMNISKTIKSGDSTNREAMAASFYWSRIMPEIDGFIRDRYGFPPNNYFNYGYALVRAAMARSIVAAGLIPALGIHHKNKYNAFCLADDLIEPFRPIVDIEVISIIRNHGLFNELKPNIKKELLSILTIDVKFSKGTSPLMIACTRLVNSFVNCLGGKNKKLDLPMIAI